MSEEAIVKELRSRIDKGNEQQPDITKIQEQIQELFKKNIFERKPLEQIMGNVMSYMASFGIKPEISKIMSWLMLDPEIKKMLTGGMSYA